MFGTAIHERTAANRRAGLLLGVELARTVTTGREGGSSALDPTRTWLTIARCNAAHACGVLAQRRFLVKKSSASLIVSAWIALRSAPSGSPQCARRNTRPTKVQVPKKTKWPPCGKNFSVACGIALVRDSAPEVGGVISSALPLTIATGIETLPRLSGVNTGPSPGAMAKSARRRASR